jgi:TonB-linked SusC/RagA family outer membrane protein
MISKRLLMVLVGTLLFAAEAFAQQREITGMVTGDGGAPLVGVQIVVKGTSTGTLTNAAGRYTIRASAGQALQFSYIGTSTVERVVGAENVINVEMKMSAISLEAVEATAMGQTASRRSLGSSQQSVAGPEIARTQKDNWANALQGRVAGVEVISNSGVPGASSQILVRGVSSVSGNNQPLLVVDGMPVDNKVQHSNQMFPSQYENRTVDFTNRGADFNPEDIESLTVLKGPEAAALYGIDAANGAIVITTKRGKAGIGGFDYSNSLRIDFPGRTPEVQRVYGQSSLGSTTWLYYGDPYPASAPRYDNVRGFFQNASSQRHNLAFNGASADSRISYRLSAGTQNINGIIPNSAWDKINVSASTQAVATSWLRSDLVVQYASDKNLQPFKGIGGPLLGLLAWPDTIDATNWQTEEGRRIRVATGISAGAEVDNPYFSVNRNSATSRTNRMVVNPTLTFTPVSWASLRTQLGIDNYNQKVRVLKDPESSFGFAANGIIDEAADVTRNITFQGIANFNRLALLDDLGAAFMVGNSVIDWKSDIQGVSASNFIDPKFISINNTRNKSAINLIRQRRVVSAFGQAQFDWRNYLYLTLTGRNDWTSTIPEERNSFFYPSAQMSFVFTDAFPALGKHMIGKLRGAYAAVGKDARPYAYAPSLESKPTSYLGYGFGFNGPNPNLKPEFAVSSEIGTELGFFGGRLGLDATIWRKETRDQIVDNVRASYGSGFILINLNGATTRTNGVEVTLRGIPIQRDNLYWDAQINFTRNRGKVLSLPDNLPEYYNSDTFLSNVRNGVKAGSSTMGLFGLWYLRNSNGDVLIDPATGLPLRDSNFTQGPYDRNPDFLVGISNTVKYKNLSLSALVDVRKGGDVFNATEWWLTQRGLSTRTLDRWDPRVVKGVLRDGLENTANPTPNSIVVIPAVNNNFYLAMSEEVFIERNVNWLRLRDVTLNYQLPAGTLGTRSASVFVTGTELLLVTNYSGLDPITNSNTAATGGSGGIGIDFGGFPIPAGVNFGVRVGF